MTRKILFLITIILHTSSLWAQAKPQNSIQNFINNTAFKYASISISVKDFSGKTIISHNPNQSLTPASILKVVTTATALERLGADYKYETTLRQNSDDPSTLLIYGSGDPTLGSERMGSDPHYFLEEWSSEITNIFDGTKGLSITVVDDIFGYESVSQKWIREDVGNYFASGTYGISVFDNTYKLHLNTLRTDTLPIIERIEPEMPNLKFYNVLTMNTTGEDAGYIVGDPLSDERTLLGNIPSRRSSFIIKGAIPNPGLYLGETLSQSLTSKGLVVESVKTIKDAYDKRQIEKAVEKIFHTHYSPPMKDIVREVNVRSNNHYAEHLIRSIGRYRNSDIYSSALNEGISEVKDLWKSKGLNTDALFMYDGCGLAPSNAVSANFVTDVLLYMQTKSDNADVFLKSLPKAGSEGTVKGLLRGSRLAGKVHVKSGSIANVRCYAGYYINGDKKYAFTVMVNNYNSPHNQVVRAIEKLLLEVF